MNRLRAAVLGLSFVLCFACSEDETSSEPSKGTAGKSAGASGRSGSAGKNGASGAGAGGQGGQDASAGSAGASEPADASIVDAAEPEPEPEPAIISKPGKYKGYSEAKYKNGYAISSQYVAVRDGTELAVDLYRPKKEDGSVVTDPLPVLFMHTPYNRRYFTPTGGERGVSGEKYPGYAARLIEYGYVVAIADFRGLYASYGTNIAYNRGEWVDAAKMDAYDLIEWLAKQPFSSGKVGMWGCSATGGSQMQAASTQPPSLKAIFPMSCEWDAYAFAVAGGVAPPQGATSTPPTGMGAAAMRDPMAEPVDGDDGRAKLMAAIAQHANGVETAGYVPYRDSVAEAVGEPWWIKSSPHTYAEQLKGSGIAMYFAANWDEGTTKHGAFFSFNNIETKTKLIVGPAGHCAWSTVQNDTGFDLAIEELRFFDHYLKDVDNGIEDEPRVTYYTINAKEKEAWRQSPQWPLEKERRTNYYLAALKVLSLAAPSGQATKDEVAVQYDVTPETLVEKGIAYESYNQSVDLEITGHPQLNLWVSSTAADGDFIVTLQDVSPDGMTVRNVTTGRLRASHRKLADAPYDNLGLPYHPSREEDLQPLVAGEPAELKIELLPVSYVFLKNHRIRVVLTFSAGAVTPKVEPAPTVTLYRNTTQRSALVLPVIPGGSGPTSTSE